MNDTFLMEKIEEFRRTASSNFWMRTAKLDDRSLVLVATGKLDAYLAIAIVLKCRLLVDKRKYERVFNRDGGPLGGFGPKVGVAQLLGLLVGDMEHDIGVLKKIRNFFAHDYMFKDLSENEMSKLCKKLKMDVGLSEEILNLAGTAERKAFLESVAAISTHLSAIVLNAISETEVINKHREEVNARTKELVENVKKGIAEKSAAAEPASLPAQSG